EASALYNRGYFGTPRSGGALELDLLEAVYLVEADRLEVRREGRRVSARDLFRAAGAAVPSFEIRYLVYRDLRQRGYVVESRGDPIDFQVYPRGGAPKKTPRGRHRRGGSSGAARGRLLRQDGRSPVAAEPPGDRVPPQGRDRRSPERRHGPADPLGAAHEGSEGHPAGLRSSAPGLRGPDRPRRDLQDRLQVRVALPRLRGRSGIAPREVSRPRGPEGTSRRMAGDQPRGATRAWREEADPLRRGRLRRAVCETRTRPSLRFLRVVATYL